MRVLVIGLDAFGFWFSRSICEMGHEVLAIERDEALVDRHAQWITRAVAGDATDPALLERFKVGDVGAAVLDYAPIGEGFSMQEIAVPTSWLGHSLLELGPHENLNLQIVAARDSLTGKLTLPPDPAAKLEPSDSLLVAGGDGDDVLKKLNVHSGLTRAEAALMALDFVGFPRPDSRNGGAGSDSGLRKFPVLQLSLISVAGIGIAAIQTVTIGLY